MMGRNKRKPVGKNHKIDTFDKSVDNSLYTLSNHAGQRIRDRFIYHVDVRDTLYRGNVSVVFSGGRFAFKYEHKCFKVIIDRRVKRGLRLERRKPRVITVSYNSKFSNVLKDQEMLFDVDRRKLVTTLVRLYDVMGDGMYGKSNKELVTDKLTDMGLTRSKFIATDSLLSDEPVMKMIRDNTKELNKIRDALKSACDQLVSSGADRVKNSQFKHAVVRSFIGGTYYVHPADKVTGKDDIRLNLVEHMFKNVRSIEEIDLGIFKVIRGAVADLVVYDYKGHRLLVYAFEHNKFRALVSRESCHFKSEFKARVALRTLVRDYHYSAYGRGRVDEVVRGWIEKQADKKIANKK